MDFTAMIFDAFTSFAGYLVTLFAGAAASYYINKFKAAKEKAEAEKEETIKAAELRESAQSKGIRSVLRNTIVRQYSDFMERGYILPYELENLERTYESYHDLGGNGMASALYEQLKNLPHIKQETEDDA